MFVGECHLAPVAFCKISDPFLPKLWGVLSAIG